MNADEMTKLAISKSQIPIKTTLERMMDAIREAAELGKFFITYDSYDSLTTESKELRKLGFKVKYDNINGFLKISWYPKNV